VNGVNEPRARGYAPYMYRRNNMTHKFLDSTIHGMHSWSSEGDAVTIVVNAESLLDDSDDDGDSIITFSENDLKAMLKKISDCRKSRENDKALRANLGA